MTPALHRAYRRTAYEAEGAIARVGHRSPAMDALLARLRSGQGAFVTAWNPFSRAMPWGWNDRMGQRLREATRRIPRAEGWGRAPGWGEQHLLLATDPRRAAVIGRRFRQNAILVVRRRQKARLALLRAGQCPPSRSK